MTDKHAVESQTDSDIIRDPFNVGLDRINPIIDTAMKGIQKSLYLNSLLRQTTHFTINDRISTSRSTCLTHTVDLNLTRVCQSMISNHTSLREQDRLSEVATRYTSQCFEDEENRDYISMLRDWSYTDFMSTSGVADGDCLSRLSRDQWAFLILGDAWMFHMYEELKSHNVMTPAEYAPASRYLIGTINEVEVYKGGTVGCRPEEMFALVSGRNGWSSVARNIRHTNPISKDAGVSLLSEILVSKNPRARISRFVIA